MDRNKTPFWQNRKIVPYLYILPNMILFLGFMIIPLIMSFYYSLNSWNGIGKMKFIALDNYAYLLHDKVFIKSMVNTFVYTAVTVPLIMVFAILIAVLLNGKMPLRGVFRSAIYAPAVVSTVVVGVVGMWIFNDQLGLINYILNLFGREAINWSTDPKYAMMMVILTTIWQRTGYNMVIYLAGLQGISGDVMEAAVIDGANAWQRFAHVTMPLLRNTHIFVLLTCMIHSFRSFDLIYTMTRGGPLNATKTIVMYVYEQAFSKNYYGRASAGGVILFVIMLIFTIIQNKAQRED